MSVVVQFASFTASGALGAEWTATGGTFSQDGQRAFPLTPATYSRAVLAQAPTITASTPIRVRYEVDLTMPTTFPATGLFRGGLVFQGGFGHFVWDRTSGGAATRFDFFARNAAGTETSYFSTSVSLGTDTTTRLRAEVTYSAFGLGVTCSYSTDGGATFTALFNSAPNLGAWNTATGQSLTSLATADKRGGIVANMAGVAGYLDNFRLTDVGSLADDPAAYAAPALVADPTLTPITLTSEVVASGQSLDVDPDFPLSPVDTWTRTDHEYDGGYRAAHAGPQSVRRRAWAFVWSNRSEDDKLDIEALRDNVRKDRSFFWTDPTTGEVLVLQFDSDLTITRVAPDAYDLSAEVSEVRSGA